jgi:hypothetical protein
MDSVLATPSWAYDFCYYYAFVAAIVVVSSIYSIFQMLMLPGLVKKMLPLTSIILGIVLSTVVTVVLTMMQFWICRGALGSRTEKFMTKEYFEDKKAKEHFAASCGAESDCTAIMGSQSQSQDSLCTCGARGFCGGCVMQNARKEGNSTDLPGIDTN